MNEGLFLAIGYGVFTLYSVGILFLGILLETKTGLSETVCRKITHISSAFLWVICQAFFGCTIHWIILNIIGTVALGFYTLSSKFTAFQRADTDKSYGLFYFGLSTAVVAMVCYFVDPDLYPYAGITYFCLALGDGFAPIVARLAGKHNVEIMPHKTVWGSVSVFLFAFLSAFVYSTLFDMQLDVVFLLSVAALTCITEFYGAKGADNLFIEFLVFGYLMLYHYGLVSLGLQIVLIASPLLAGLAIYTKAMAVSGGICAFCLFALVGFFGKDLVPVLFISLLFLVSTVVVVIGKKIKAKRREASEQSKPRTAKQVFAVGLLALVALAVYYFTDNVIFYYVFFLALTEQIADSVASDIGSLTKRANVSILTFRPVAKGISGGVSLLGTGSAFISSFALMGIPLALGKCSVTVYLILAALAFAGTLVDSLVGALAQSLYECVECKQLIEVDCHCGTSAKLVKGFRIIDNIAVNHISGLITCCLGLVLFYTL